MNNIDEQIRAWFRDEIRPEAQTILTEYLGIYSYSNGQTTSAIKVEDGAREAMQPSVDGLECVIMRSLQDSISNVFEGYSYTTQVQISLKQWDISKTALEPMTVFLENFSQSIDSIVRIPPTELIVEEIRLTFSKSFLIESQSFL